MKRLGWKLLVPIQVLWILPSLMEIVLTPVLDVLAPVPPGVTVDRNLPLALVHAVHGVAVVVGLVGYAWRIRIGQPLVWQMVLAGQALWVCLYLAATAQVLQPDFPKTVTRRQFAFAGLLISFLVLSSVALFRYGFREDLWKQQESN